MSIIKGKRILITGGAGFIGLHLCKQLLNLGHQVVCMDNLFSSSKVNLNDILSHHNFRFVEHDVCLPYHEEVDAIYNLACPASPRQYQLDPIFTMKTSVFGAIHALELAKKRDIPVLQASTSEVYGDPLVHPQREGYWGHVNPIGIRSCYDEGKRAAETLFFDYHRAHGVPIKIARIFNTYGPHMLMDDGRVVSNFIVQALSNRPITIYGDGMQTRSFCFVTDLVDALMRLMAEDKTVTGPFNLGNPFEFTVKELAHLVIELTGSSSEIQYLPLPSDDPRQRKPDITLAKEKLSWEPKVDLMTGLRATIAHFQQQLQALR